MNLSKYKTRESRLILFITVTRTKMHFKNGFIWEILSKYLYFHKNHFYQELVCHVPSINVAGFGYVCRASSVNRSF